MKAGYRALLVVPLCGPAASLARLWCAARSRDCSRDSTIDLLQTFAAQSVLAIQNARLFEDVEARTRELAKSLEELGAAQDRLIQTEKLASLGQLTAGIAHEIKNPLNFVNNFAALSVELIDELKDALQARPRRKTRSEIDGVDGHAGGNLEKVVQHGKRADSIVKNMLLHSRAGSGERRLVESTPSSRRASTSLITARAPRSRASTSRSSGRSTQPQARSSSTRRRSPGCSST